MPKHEGEQGRATRQACWKPKHGVERKDGPRGAKQELEVVRWCQNARPDEHFRLVWARRSMLDAGIQGRENEEAQGALGAYVGLLTCTCVPKREQKSRRETRRFWGSSGLIGVLDAKRQGRRRRGGQTSL